MTALHLLPPIEPDTDTEPADTLTGWLARYSSPRTRAEYRHDVDGWLTWCTVSGLHAYDAGRPDIDAWVRDMDERGLSRATVNRRVVALRQWYDHLTEDLGIIDRNPVARVRTPRVHRTPRHAYLSAEQVTGLAAAAAKDGPAWELALRLLAVNGLRVSEVAGLHGEDLSPGPDGTIIAAVHGKGDKPRLAVLSGRSVALVEQLRVGQRSSVWGRGPICPSVRTLQRHLNRWAEQAGLDVHVSPHTLRHWAITTALNLGATTRDVRDFAGHADERTTAVYDRDRGNIARNPGRALAELLDHPTTHEEDT